MLGWYEFGSRALSDFSSVPNQISHKDLNSLLLSAFKESQSNNNDDAQTENLTQKEQLESLLLEWSHISNQVVQIIKKKNPSIINNLNSRQAMALGALEVHLSMAIQAGNELEKDID